jgi:hypothetical protein
MDIEYHVRQSYEWQTGNEIEEPGKKMEEELESRGFAYVW